MKVNIFFMKKNIFFHEKNSEESANINVEGAE